MTVRIPLPRLRTVLIGSSYFLVGFLVGGYVGFQWLAKPDQLFTVLGARWMASQYARIQYQRASYEPAKQALAAYIHLLNASPAPAAPWWPDSMGRQLDLGVAYSRLALLEEREKHPENADLYWSKAEKHMQAAGWTFKWSREYLRDFVERLNRAEDPVVPSTTSVPAK